MTQALDLYPPPPDDVPKDLTKPSSSYRLRVLIVLVSLVLFVALYVGLVAGSAYLSWWCFKSIGAPSKPAIAISTLKANVQWTNQLEKTFNAAADRFQRREITNLEFVQIIERDLLPSWKTGRESLHQITNVPPDCREWFNYTSQYVMVRELGLKTLCQALRQQDDKLTDQARKLAIQANNLADQAAARPIRVPNTKDNDPTFWLVIGGILSGLLCLFLVKGFFKRKPPDTSKRFEVTEEEQPVLFAFIRELCRDTHAPLPRRLYLTAEVNAAVFYPDSFLSLFYPARKNLLIGLGLVNQLNLSEFKAVLAHEFGHFSQSSMKLGGYVYTSNRVIGDLVYGRDWLDNFLAAAGRIDLRISIFVWGFAGILWVLRKSLQGMFRVINFANSALSRQMEFNADLVAVSVTGSDALIHALARLDFANDSLMKAWVDLTAAADHELYSRDLFYHQTHAAEYLRVLRKDPKLGKPPDLPRDPNQTVQVFQPEDISVPKMWATHPANHAREVNAKERYIRSLIDERSPWLLFQDAAAIREAITHSAYVATRDPSEVELQDPKVVQTFIDDEHAETTYPPHYHGMYDNRYLKPGKLEELVSQVQGAFADSRQLSDGHGRLYGHELKARMKTHESRQKEIGLLVRVAQGAVELTGKDFQHRGGRYLAGDAGRLLADVQKELDEDYDWLGKLDRQVFLVHYQMARQVGEESRFELEQRYHFHLGLQEIVENLSAKNQEANGVLAYIAGQSQLNEAQFQETVAIFRGAHDTLRDKLKVAAKLRLPVLKNMTAGEPLGPFLLSKPLVRSLDVNAKTLDGNWISQFMGQMAEVLDKCQRLHFKSVGGILSLQEKISALWSAKHA